MPSVEPASPVPSAREPASSDEPNRPYAESLGNAKILGTNIVKKNDSVLITRKPVLNISKNVKQPPTLKLGQRLRKGRDAIQIDDAVSTISGEYLLEFTSEYGIPKDLHPELPGPEDTIVDFLEGKVGAPKDGMPPAGSYSALDVTTLNTRRTLIQKQTELILCLVGLSRRYLLGDDVYPTFLYDDDREMDLFNLISAPNPAKVKTGTRPRAAHEVPLLTATANRVIDMDTTGASGFSGTPSTVEKSPLDFTDEDLLSPNTEGVRTEEQIQDELS
ncbi:hypothetical protein Tco_0600165 [Tanacetum coccineum]|uniref:Uncharacterized protein n=1 Tax=Tanacetum coccineum TaxID=301880 RepID=A0ABQ4WB20_9ASTR